MCTRKVDKGRKKYKLFIIQFFSSSFLVANTQDNNNFSHKTRQDQIRPATAQFVYELREKYHFIPFALSIRSSHWLPPTATSPSDSRATPAQDVLFNSFNLLFIYEIASIDRGSWWNSFIQFATNRRIITIPPVSPSFQHRIDISVSHLSPVHIASDCRLRGRQV